MTGRVSRWLCLGVGITRQRRKEKAMSETRAVLTFSVEIEQLSNVSVTALITKPEGTKIGQRTIRGLVASAMCERIRGLEYSAAYRQTELQTEWNPKTKSYDVWGYEVENVTETVRRVKIRFPDDDRNLFKKQPDGSYAASFDDLFGRREK